MEIILTVSSRVRLNYVDLKTQDLQTYKRIRKAFTYKNPVYQKTMNMGFPVDGIPEYYRSWKKKKSYLYFGRGCLRRLGSILKEAGHTVKIRNRKLSFPPENYNSNTVLRPEQEGASDAILKHKQGLIRGDCSIGKTVILLEAIARSGQPAVVVVWSDVHQKQWIREAMNSKLLNLNPDLIGGVGGIFNNKKEFQKLFGNRKYDKRPLGLLNICMQQSLRNIQHINFFKNNIGFLGFDECQSYGANTFEALVHHFPAEYRVGVSANERRKDGKTFLIYDSIGDVVHKIKTPENSSRMNARVNLVVTEFKDEDYAFDRDYTGLLNRMAMDRKRNKLIVKKVKRQIEMGKLCLVLVERKEQVLILNDMLSKYRGGMIIGKQQNKQAIRDSDLDDDHKQILLDYNADEEFDRVVKLGYEKELDYILATKKGDVGLSIKPIEYVAIATPSAGDLERLNQQMGRAERSYSGDQWLLDKFGEKGVPVVDYFWDKLMDNFKKHGKDIRAAYGRRVRTIEPKKKEKYFK